MASYTVAAGALAKHDATLVASTVDTVTFTDDVDLIEVVSDGAAKMYVRVDGTSPTVSGANSYILPASVSSREIPVSGDAGTITVKLISSGTPTYSVTKLR